MEADAFRTDIEGLPHPQTTCFRRCLDVIRTNVLLLETIVHKMAVLKEVLKMMSL